MPATGGPQPTAPVSQESQRRPLNTLGEQVRIREQISRRVDTFIVNMFGPTGSSGSQGQ